MRWIYRLPAVASTWPSSQHVQMNVSDKARLYREARRVLALEGPPRVVGRDGGP